MFEKNSIRSDAVRKWPQIDDIEKYLLPKRRVSVSCNRILQIDKSLATKHNYSLESIDPKK